MNKTALLVGIYAMALFTSCSTIEEENKVAGKYIVTSPALMDTSYTK